MAQKIILCIPDSHFPFVNKNALNKIYKVAAVIKPKIIISLGDLYDFYAFSRFPKLITDPEKEVAAGRGMAEEMWGRLRKISPKAKCFQLLGNHCERPIKQVMAKVPEMQSFFDFATVFKFSGVETMPSEREELIIGNILFQHGFRSKLGDHAIHNGMHTVCGHSHRPGVFYTRLGKETIWEMNCGHIADENHPALSYTRQRQICKWSCAVGVIDEAGPRIICLGNV